MNTVTYLRAATALLALTAGALQAQTAAQWRNEDAVRAEAIATAHDPDPTGSLSTRGMAEITNSPVDPEKVRQEAIATAHDPDPTGSVGTRGFGEYKGMADPAQVAAQARAAAVAPDQNVASGSKYNSKVVSTMPASAAVAGK